MSIRDLRKKSNQFNFTNQSQIEQYIDDLISEIFKVVSSVNKNDINGIAGDWTYGKLNDDGAREILKELQRVKKSLKEKSLGDVNE